MRLMQSSNLWGNGYRHRFYIDGKRVSKQVFDHTLESKVADSWVGSMETHNSTGYRLIWESV